ncbi:hypothetical protein JCM16303_000672 [Sporobolomyces ruberrimus]
MDSFSEIAEEEWVDCKAVFETALSELSTGQLIQDPRYTMMDLMSAIEINDPRTDSFAAARNSSREQLPDFDASRILDVQEVVWVIDEMMRLEATFQDGQPLMSTLWNCNYLRVPSLTTLASTCTEGRVDSVQGVFRAMLLGILKTQEIVWEECCKGQVYEHEDVHLASSTLTFDKLMAACYTLRSSRSPSPPPTTDNPLLVPGQQAEPTPRPAPDRTVSIDDVLRLLDEASAWLQSHRVDDPIPEIQEAWAQLTLRVALRIDLLYILALLTFPAHTSPSQIQNHLTRISTYMSRLPSSSSSPPQTTFVAPPYLKAIFAPSPSIPLLATSAPPRLIEPFPVVESYDKNVRDLVSELGGLCQLWEGWRREGQDKLGWKDVKEYSRMMARREVSPYLRSLHQTVLTSTPSHVFSVSPLIHFAISFLATHTSIPPSFFLEDLYTIHQAESDYSSPGHVIFAWLEKFAQELVRTSLPLSGQNRTRQFRWIRKSVPNWVSLVSETKETVVPLLLSIVKQDHEEARRGIERIELAMRSTFVELVLENVGSGFESGMELYRADEWSRVWFVLAIIAEEHEGNMRELLANGSENVAYLKSKAEGSAALKEMARGSFIMASLCPSPQPKFSSPFLPSVAIDQDRADRGRFEQRFDWIRAGAGRDESILRSPIEYAAYFAEVLKTRSVERVSLAQEGKACFARAVEASTSLAGVPLAERGSSVRPEFTLRHLASMRRTAFANQGRLAALLASSEMPTATPPSLKWDNPWFPIFS